MRAMRVHDLVACPGCGSTASTDLVYGGRTLRRCSRCALVHERTYGDPEDLYVEGYLTDGERFGVDVRDPRFQDYLHLVAHRRLRRVESVHGGTGSLLDVGCGSGEVLATAAERGWHVAGCEPVEESAAFARARRLDVRTALLQDSGFPEASFDVVSAFHVLEHMTDGRGFLSLIARWAKPGGLVVVEVPNWRSFHRRGWGAGWPHFKPNEHVAQYEPRTVRSTMAGAGLRPVSVRTPTWLVECQTYEYALGDLGRPALAGRLGARRDRRPGVLGRAVLGAVGVAYDRAGTGQVVLAMARTPG